VARACTVCESPDRVAIDEGLVGGRSALSLASTYGLGARAIGRHKSVHLSRALAAIEAKRQGTEERRAENLTDRLESLIRKIEDLVETSHAAGAAGQMLAAARELRACWELQAKLTGELPDRPAVVVNMLASPEVTLLVTTLLRALAPYPEARIAAAAALDTIDVEAEEVTQ
jgi:hypothetical protein